MAQRRTLTKLSGNVSAATLGLVVVMVAVKLESLMTEAPSGGGYQPRCFSPRMYLKGRCGCSVGLLGPREVLSCFQFLTQFRSKFLERMVITF